MNINKKYLKNGMFFAVCLKGYYTKPPPKSKNTLIASFFLRKLDHKTGERVYFTSHNVGEMSIYLVILYIFIFLQT